MSDTDESRYHALRSRDTRFDGVFFVGVLSTGVYCRPICPSRTPLRKNCRFFPLAVLAQQAGFRPCLRCRPEVAPETHRQASDTMGTQLTRLLRNAALEGLRAGDAAKLSGWSDRQLRRSLARECGLTPVAIMQAERLLFAKRLLHDTSLPMTEVAQSAGFRSVRRFNAAFSEACGLSPTAVRKARNTLPAKANIMLRLDYRGPYAWREMLGWLRARATLGVEVVTDEAWARTVGISGHEGWLCVTQDEARSRLNVEVTPTLAAVLRQIVSRLRHLFDLDANPQEISALFARDPLLGPVVKRHPGLRVPGAWDVFESAMRTVIGQQISVTAASTVASRLAQVFGKACAPNPHHLQRLAVAPSALARASIGAIASLGMPAARAMTLQTLAKKTLAGALDFSPLATLDEVRGTLLSMPGIGPWTADYIAMRALRHPDAFPSGDLGLRKAITREKTATAHEAESISMRWKPWRAYAAALLWQSLVVH